MIPGRLYRFKKGAGSVRLNDNIGNRIGSITDNIFIYLSSKDRENGEFNEVWVKVIHQDVVGYLIFAAISFNEAFWFEEAVSD